MLSPRWSKRLFYLLLALHVALAYPLALAFFAEPNIVLINWNLLAGFMLAWFIPLKAVSFERGMGYLVAFLVIVPFTLVVLLGHGMSLGYLWLQHGMPIDKKSFEPIFIAWEAVGLLGYFGACGAMIGSYLVTAIALHFIQKASRGPESDKRP
ncbi:MAG: hypothetical protein ACKVP0_02870 [Pirellulaceae bacterium]